MTDPLHRRDAVFRIITTVADFDEIADQWNTLFRKAEWTPASMTVGAVRAFLAHRIRVGQSASIVLCHRAGELVAALPLVMWKARNRRCFATFGDEQSYGVDFLIGSNEEGTLRNDMLCYVFQQYPDTFFVRLVDIPEDSRTRQVVCGGKGFFTNCELNRYGSYFEVPDCEEAIVKRVSHNFRKNLRKQEARLDALPDVQFEVVSAVDAQPQHLERFASLEVSGWKGAQGTAIASDPNLLAYYGTLVCGLSSTAHLEWHFLSACGQTIAANLAVRTDRGLSLIKIAYDENFASSAPGSMLFLRVVRRELQAFGRTVVDCLTDMPWHQNWKMSRRAYYTVHVYPSRFVPIVLGWWPRFTVDLARRSQAFRRIAKLLGPTLRKRIRSGVESG